MLHRHKTLTIIQLIQIIVIINYVGANIIFEEFSNLQCEESTPIIIRKLIPINLTSNNLTVKGFLKDNDGSVIMKVFPIYENSVNPSNEQIISSFKTNYQNFQSSQNSGGIVDIQSLFLYKQQVLIGLNLFRKSVRLMKIIVVYLRISKSNTYNIIYANCSNFNIKTTLIDSEVTTITANCKYPGTNYSAAIFHNRCVCYPGYYGSYCSVKIQPISKMLVFFKIPSHQSKHFVYTPIIRQAEDLSVHLYHNNSSSQSYSFLAALQPIATYPHLLVANYYNNVILPNSFKVDNGKYFLLLTVTNLSPTLQQYGIQIKNAEEEFNYLKIILIIIAILVVIGLITLFITCYALGSLNFQSRKIVNNPLKNATMFPSIKFQFFKNKIMNPKQLDYKQTIICSICLQQIVNKSVIKYLYCNHIHDANCLQQWMKKEQSCPLCRQKFTPQNIQAWQQKINEKVPEDLIEKIRQNGQKKQNKKRERRFSTQMNKGNFQWQFDHTIQTFTERIQQMPSTNNKKNKSMGQQHQQPKAMRQKEEQTLNNLLQESQNQIQQEVYQFYKRIWLYYHMNLQNQNQEQIQRQRFQKIEVQFMNNGPLLFESEQIQEKVPSSENQENRRQKRTTIQIQIIRFDDDSEMGQ